MEKKVSPLGMDEHARHSSFRVKKSLWTTIRGSVQNYWLFCSLPGITHSRRYGSTGLKLFWMAVFLAGALLTGYSVSKIVVDYLSYPVITYVSMSHAQKIRFPAVTVCNSNPIVCYKLAQFRDQLPELWDASGCEVIPLMVRDVRWVVCPKFEQEGFKKALDGYLDGVKNMTELVFAVVDANDYSYAENSPLLDFMPGTNRTTQLVSLFNTILYMAPADFKARNGSKAFDALVSYFTDKPGSESPNEHLSGQPPHCPQAASGNLTKALNSSEKAEKVPSFSDSQKRSAGETSEEDLYDDDAELDGLGVDDIFSATEEYLKHVNLMQAFSNVEETLKQRIVTSFRRFVWSCTFQGYNCLKEDNFEVILVPPYGTCFMFNTNWNPKDKKGGKRVSGNTGEETGLSLVLFVDQANYMKHPAASSAGARVTIHSPDEWPNPVEQGYLVQSNTRSIFALQVTNMSRLESPYETDCFSDWTRTDYKAVSSSYDPNVTLGYSQVQCERLRLLADIAQNCRCLHPGFHDYFLHKGTSYSDFPPCNISIGADNKKCIIRVWKFLQNETPLCGPPCQEIAYDVALSTASWPSESYFNMLLENVAAKLGYQKDYLVTLRHDEEEYLQTKRTLQKELLKVEVFFRSLNIQVIKEQPKYDLNGLVSDVGGVLGIYLGVCVLMLIEILEFFVFLLFDICRYCFGVESEGENDREEIEWRPRSTGRDLKARRGRSLSPRPDSFSRVVASIRGMEPAVTVPVYRQGTSQ